MQAGSLIGLLQMHRRYSITWICGHDSQFGVALLPGPNSAQDRCSGVFNSPHMPVPICIVSSNCQECKGILRAPWWPSTIRPRLRPRLRPQPRIPSRTPGLDSAGLRICLVVSDEAMSEASDEVRGHGAVLRTWFWGCDEHDGCA